jgi:hypothetical protein
MDRNKLFVAATSVCGFLSGALAGHSLPFFGGFVMFTKGLLAAVAGLGLTVGGLIWANASRSTEEAVAGAQVPGPKCCYLQKPCCPNGPCCPKK